MATAKEVLAVAAKDIGYKESPANSNKTKFGKWFGLDGQPWCAMAVCYWFKEAGAYDLLPFPSASCGAMMRAAQAAGQWVTGDYQPGDIVIYDFPGGASTDHCGIVESFGGTTLLAIEGNTAVGNDSNGGEVMRRTRMASQVIGAIRPKYEKKNVVADEATLAMKWAIDNKIIQDGNWNATPTRRQIAIIFYRFAKLIGKA